MNYYDETLEELAKQTARKKQLAAMLIELKKQKDALSERVDKLEASKIAEQADVDRLEHRSLAALFYTIAGKKQEKIDKERVEAYEARVKYDAAAGELANVTTDLESYQLEYVKLRSCETKYQEALDKKAQALKESDNSAAAEILSIEQNIREVTQQKKEVQEAVAAGNTALHTSEEILKKLDSAHGWGTYDLIGGGLVAGLAKHSYLDEAQGLIEQLQKELGRFRTELADVAINADMKLSIDGFLRFADFFFDDLISDWVVQDKINHSIENVKNTKNQIANVLNHLLNMNVRLDIDKERLKSKLDDCVRSSAID